MRKRVAITLSGGGARGAYEAGVVRAIAEMGKFGTSPFDIITGVSAGAINGTSLAADAQDFDRATKKLWETWEGVETQNVFKSDPISLLKTGATLIKDLSLGQWFEGHEVTHLLDTAPLLTFLSEKIDTKGISANVRSGLLHGVSLSATDYYCGKLVTFFEGDQDIQEWKEDASIGVRTKITVPHIMASTAIPIFFPPVRLGESEYGDGGIGQRSPLSDAIHLGADRILVVGLQYSPTKKDPPLKIKRKPITLGEIAGTLLNALFLNSLDSDLARLQQTNRVVTELDPGGRRKSGRLRAIPALTLCPSQDLGSIDTDHFSRLPFPLRRMLKGLGVSEERGWDLLSYLAFENGYVSALLKLGYSDAMKRQGEILAFINA